MVEDGLVLAMLMIMSEQEGFGRLCATVSSADGPLPHADELEP